MKEWQPIDTAPKDAAILIWDGQNINLGGWDQWHRDNGWWVCFAHGEQANWSDDDYPQPVIKDPTHWMPLPAPPTREASAKERA